MLYIFVLYINSFTLLVLVMKKYNYLLSILLFTVLQLNNITKAENIISDKDILNYINQKK